MIILDRRKDKKWIMQKNVSSTKIIESYLEALSTSGSKIDYEDVQNKLRINNIYKGRSNVGSLSTMGVRFSQMCFYMFGYKVDKTFIPSPMTQNILNDNSKIKQESNALINLYSMQFPNPYSKTHYDFKIYVGRLFVKLLLDDRIERKLYIDEMLWFIPFLKTMDENIPSELMLVGSSNAEK